MPAVQATLEGLGLAPRDLEAYVIGLGPGSFTGLRAGLSFIKGLHLANPRPAVGVSSLQALACNARSWRGRIVAAVDAKKDQVFAAAFNCDGCSAPARVTEDEALGPLELVELARGNTLVVGDGLKKYGEMIRDALGGSAFIAPEPLWYPRAAWLAELAKPRLLNGESDDVESMVPFYVRHSDAELKLGKRVDFS